MSNFVCNESARATLCDLSNLFKAAAAEFRGKLTLQRAPDSAVIVRGDGVACDKWHELTARAERALNLPPAYRWEGVETDRPYVESLLAGVAFTRWLVARPGWFWEFDPFIDQNQWPCLKDPFGAAHEVLLRVVTEVQDELPVPPGAESEVPVPPAWIADHLTPVPAKLARALWGRESVKLAELWRTVWKRTDEPVRETVESIVKRANRSFCYVPEDVAPSCHITWVNKASLRLVVVG